MPTFSRSLRTPTPTIFFFFKCVCVCLVSSIRYPGTGVTGSQKLPCRALSYSAISPLPPSVLFILVFFFFFNVWGLHLLEWLSTFWVQCHFCFKSSECTLTHQHFFFIIKSYQEAEGKKMGTRNQWLPLLSSPALVRKACQLVLLRLPLFLLPHLKNPSLNSQEHPSLNFKLYPKIFYIKATDKNILS